MGRPARYSSEKVLRRKPSGVWEAVWRAPLTGDIKRKTTGKTIEREAQLELIAIKTVSDHPTIADLIDRYIARQDSSGKEIAPIKASLRPVCAFMGTLTADAAHRTTSTTMCSGGARRSAGRATQGSSAKTTAISATAQSPKT